MCDEQAFLKRDMDFPIGRSRDDRGKSLPEYLNCIRLEAQDLVDKGTLTLGCDSKLISNKTAVGNIYTFPQLIENLESLPMENPICKVMQMICRRRK